MSRDLTVIHQPDFLPYLGFFDRLLNCDKFIVLDDVQFVKGTKNAWQHRDKIKTVTGESWISLSVQKTHLGTLINEVRLVDEVSWRDRMKNQIIQSYLKAEYFSEIMPIVEEIIFFKTDKMVDYNWHSIQRLMSVFEIDVEAFWSSRLPHSGKSNDLVVSLLQAVNSRKYLSGVGARAYFDEKPFLEAQIEVHWQQFDHPVYPQLHGNFIPFLSSIDMLFNVGKKKSVQILRGHK